MEVEGVVAAEVVEVATAVEVEPEAVVAAEDLGAAAVEAVDHLS